MAAMEGTAQILVRGVTPQLREALINDARERDLSINETAIRVIAEAYGLPYHEPETPPRFREVAGTSQLLNLDVPESMRTGLKIMVAPTSNTVQGVVLAALCRKYGLPEPPTRRRAA